jgi:hypothetical protein
MYQGVTMSLETVLKEIKQVKPFAEENVETGALETLNGRRGRKRQAQDRLNLLREDYIAELMRSAVFILVSGSSRDEFTALAKEFHSFVADPESFYRDLASRVAPVLYEGKTAVANMFDVLGRHLEDKANELNIVGYPQLIFKDTYQRNIKDSEDFVALVKSAINEQVGGEIAGIQAVRSIADEAIEKGHASRVTPIVLNSGDDRLTVDLLDALTRLSPRVFLVVAGKCSKAMRSIDGAFVLKEVNKENVEQTLTTINKLVRK